MHSCGRPCGRSRERGASRKAHSLARPFFTAFSNCGHCGVSEWRHISRGSRSAAVLGLGTTTCGRETCSALCRRRRPFGCTFVLCQPYNNAPSGSMTSIVHFGSATSEQLPALYFLPGSMRLRACVDSRRDGAVCCDTESGLSEYYWYSVYVQVVGELLSVSVGKELWCSTGNFTDNRVSDQPSVDVWLSSPWIPAADACVKSSLLHATLHVRPHRLSLFERQRNEAPDSAPWRAERLVSRQNHDRQRNACILHRTVLSCAHGVLFRNKACARTLVREVATKERTHISPWWHNLRTSRLQQTSTDGHGTADPHTTIDPPSSSLSKDE